jgi:type III pantothenate kinase
MKVLAIDAGNTRIKWGIADGRGWLQKSSLPTQDADALRSVFEKFDALDHIVISNVAGALVGQHIAAALAHVPVTPHWAQGQRTQCGVRSSYSDPTRLGSDRWAALVAARHLFDGACVIATIWTTMTVDALSGEGLFLGGFIIPGIALMRSSLAENTAQLAVTGGSFSFFPVCTEDAIASGAINALAGAVERMIGFMLEAGEADALVVLSGGDAESLSPQLHGRVEVVEDLVLQGLAIIATDLV